MVVLHTRCTQGCSPIHSCCIHKNVDVFRHWTLIFIQLRSRQDHLDQTSLLLHILSGNQSNYRQDSYPSAFIPQHYPGQYVCCVANSIFAPSKECEHFSRPEWPQLAPQSVFLDHGGMESIEGAARSRGDA